MDLLEEVLQTTSKEAVVQLTQAIGQDPDKFAQLMEIFLHGELRSSHRASWVVGHCADAHPELITPYLEVMSDALKTPRHDAAKRNIIRVFQDQEIPEALMGQVYDQCFNFLSSPQEPVAIRVFSMTVLANICQHFPELAQEVILVIEAHMPMGSPGFKSRGKRTLKQLYALSRKG